MQTKGIYYKYISLENPERFLDILLNKRLYMPTYKQMNDPMEGIYATWGMEGSSIHEINSRRLNLRMCCLSKSPNDVLMWSHYANAHKGCCLEVEVRDGDGPYDIEYSSALPKIDNPDDVKGLLCHKNSAWEYENEVRFFKEEGKSSSFLKVNIKKVCFGMNVSPTDYALYRKLIKVVYSDKLEIEQILKSKKREMFTLDGSYHY